MQHILGQVRRCVEDYHMIEAGDKVAVGVSGGKDSLLTLTALARLRDFYPISFQLEAITLETGTPGMSFDAVAELCRELEVPYTRIHVPVYQIVRIGCFQPVTYLDRTGITQIRPLLYCREDDIRRTVERLRLPVVHNPCPANGSTRRQEVKDLIHQLEGRYPDIKQKLFGSLQRYPLYGWNLEQQER